MDAVYQETRFDPKKLPKVHLSELLSTTEPPKQLDWMESQKWIPDNMISKIRF